MATVTAPGASEASSCTPSPGAAEANSVRATSGETAESCDFTESDVSAVYQFVARRVANRADAADIAQQALLVGCAKRLTHRGGPLLAWLIVIARRLIVDHFRSVHRFQFLDLEALSETDWALQSPPAVFENRERLMRWLDCVARRLPPGGADRSAAGGRVRLPRSRFGGDTAHERAELQRCCTGRGFGCTRSATGTR